MVDSCQTKPNRLSTIENADRIVCIGNGGVLEQVRN
jgi:ABC-type transport system involved in Fe-S cluster assembly fused permease/ATPase subunit